MFVVYYLSLVVSCLLLFVLFACGRLLFVACGLLFHVCCVVCCCAECCFFVGAYLVGCLVFVVSFLLFAWCSSLCFAF